MSEYKYTIVEANEDTQKAMIQKENVKVKFTLTDLESDVRAVNKIVEREVAQLKLDEASLQNVINNHPEVLEATEEETKKAVALTLYNGFKNKVHETKNRLAEIENAKVEYEKELAEIEAQTGLKVIR